MVQFLDHNRVDSFNLLACVRNIFPCINTNVLDNKEARQECMHIVTEGDSKIQQKIRKLSERGNITDRPGT